MRGKKNRSEERERERERVTKILREEMPGAVSLQKETHENSMRGKETRERVCPLTHGTEKKSEPDPDDHPEVPGFSTVGTIAPPPSGAKVQLSVHVLPLKDWSVQQT